MSGREPAARLVERLIPEAVRRLRAYHVDDARGLVKLDAMENPYPWPPEVVSEWLERLRDVEPNRYPDPRAGALAGRLADVMGVPAGAAVLLGNGSDELIQLLVLALGARGPVLAPDPSFAMYRLCCEALGRACVTVDLDPEDFSLRLEATLEAVARHRPALVFLAYPNNPTGNLFDRAAVEAVIEAAPGVVVVDEAYAPFAGESFMGELERHPNLVVMRTVSKLGLAGLRLGMIAAAPEWIAELDKLRLPYNINALTQASAEVALSHYPLFLEQTRRIVAERDRQYAALAALNRIRVWPSRANFHLLRMPAGEGTRVAEGLRERRILVKDLGRAGPALADCLRVSVGRPEENALFEAALRELV